MKEKSRKNFTAKIIFSYSVLGLLGLVVSIFIYSEIKKYTSSELLEGNDQRLLKTSSFLSDIYIAEHLSTLAQQSNTRTSLKKYTQKIDSLFTEIDTLKNSSTSTTQNLLLDSIEQLLHKKVYNVTELRRLRQKNDKSNSIDSLLKQFNKIELSVGHITPESFVSNFSELPKKSQEVIKNYVTFLNKNIPSDKKSEKLDSVLFASKVVLSEAKLESEKTKQDLNKKKRELSNANLALSLKLQRIVSSINKEIALNTLENEKMKKNVLSRSIRLAGFSAIIGLFIVALFSFLIHKDFWKIQMYRTRLESEKAFSDSVLKSREQLIATVGHDLKTPLNTIQGYSELLETTSLNRTQKAYLDNVKSASTYVDGLVNDLLDFSKIEADKIIVSKKPFRLDYLIIEIADNLKQLYNKKEVSVFFNISEKFNTPIIGDSLRVKQILTNLIGNAFKFTEEGSITIDANPERENKLSISVRDTGIGIRKEKQELVFKEFLQAEKNTGKKYGGYGLGLTISKKLSNLLKGDIKLKSKEGIGSVFTLHLPLEFIPEQESTELGTTNLSSISLLIIDDDIPLLGLIGEMCKIAGIKAHTFSNFNTIKKNENITYDIVLTDIQMPIIDGFKVLKKLKLSNYAHYNKQPIIAMTGQTNIDKSEYYSNGFSTILQKPFSKQKFLEEITAIIDVENTKKVISHSFNHAKKESFCIKTIASFLENDTVAITKILETFIQETKENMVKLNRVVKSKKIKEVNEITHRMLPMFRQLKVHNAIPYLEKLETITSISNKAIKERLATLEKHVKELSLDLENYITTNLSRND